MTRAARIRVFALFVLLTLAGVGAGHVSQETSGEEALGPAPPGPFGHTRLNTADGLRASIDDFFLSSDCALCHPRQWQELKGSMHSVAHEDRFYRSFAELARREAGEEVYRYCSGCHSPAGVVTGLIPSTPEAQLPEVARAGVTCDVCHQVSGLSGRSGHWGEPGNASLVLSPGREKGGTLGEITRNPAHTGRSDAFYATSEFCASCHTVIHPTNGLRIEHTYDEWKRSIYAEKGIQCQDCHMRSVKDAESVASTLRPVRVRGTWARNGPLRDIAPHHFIGGNVEADILADGPRHARMAEQRLQGAAVLSLTSPMEVEAGEELAFQVVVTNVGAGHDLPTSLTELRQMWLHVSVRTASGEVLLESGALDESGAIPEGTARFGAAVVDAQGHETHRPWEAVAFGWKRTIPAKGSDRETYRVTLPASLNGPVEVQVRLLYRIAPPSVVKEVMGDEAFVPRVIEMATTARRLQPRGSDR